MKAVKAAKKILVYKTAGKVLNKHLKNKVVPPNLLPENEDLKNKISTLVELALEHLIHLDDIIEKTGLFEKDPELDKPLTKIFITELLWGKKELNHPCEQVKKFNVFSEAIKKVAVDIGALSKEGSDSDEEDEEENVVLEDEDDNVDAKENDESVGDKEQVVDAQVPIKKKKQSDSKYEPRYVRVLKNKQSMEDAIKELCANDWVEVENIGEEDYSSFLTLVKNLEENEFIRDYHFDDLLVFSDKAKIKKVDFSKGFLVIRKSSLLPTFFLNPSQGSTVLDMTAGTGINAIRLGHALNNKGKVFSLQNNTKFIHSFNDTIKSSTLSNITQQVLDPSRAYDTRFSGVDYILFEAEVTPKAFELPAIGDNIRVTLTHALSSFRNAKRVVYTTQTKKKSLNEELVHQVISQTPYYKLVDASKLIKGPWKTKAAGDNEVVNSRCIYAIPDIDYTNTCFIAVFEQVKSGEVNDLLGTCKPPVTKRKMRHRNEDGKRIKLDKPVKDEDDSTNSDEEVIEEELHENVAEEHEFEVKKEEVANGFSEDEDKLVINEEEKDECIDGDDDVGKPVVEKSVKKNKKRGNKRKKAM